MTENEHEQQIGQTEDAANTYSSLLDLMVNES